MSNAEELRAKAAESQRMAEATLDKQAAQALLDLAAEYDDRAVIARQHEVKQSRCCDEEPNCGA
jgi:hypothetical protein